MMSIGMETARSIRTALGIYHSSSGKACILALAVAAGLARPEVAAAQESWTATTETEAERAYRSVYERSLAGGKPRAAVIQTKPVTAKPLPAKAAKTAKRGKAAKADNEADAVIPDLPERNEKRVAEQAAGTTVAEAPPAGGPEPAPIKIDTPAVPETGPAAKTAWRSPIDLMGNPVIPEPNLGEVITTQVINEDHEPTAEQKRAAPGPAEQYCSNIANAATDARFAWQKQTLLQTEEQIKQRVEELKGKIAEYQKWLARRDEFSRKAQAAVTDIYAKMKPDAAAQQLMALDEETAAAVITKLNPRTASALMAEMDPKQAARLTAIISGSAKGPKGKPPAKPQAGGT